MAQVEKVYRCDECSRVVAISNPDGSLIIEARHDKGKHRTRIVPPPSTERDPSSA